jgi:sodium/hydrogen antiporter
LFGAVFGVIMGYVGRKLFGKIIRKSESDIEDSDGFEKGLGHGSSWFTQEAVITIYLSFIVFLIGCAATLGIDDLLVSFFAGTAFAWTRWYSGHTEEFKFISSLDYLMNCCYFIYLGSIIPFNEFNNALHVTFAKELNIWRLILIGLVVLGIRRLPVVCLLFKFIPDIRNFKESLFVGHFGAIGVGAIYSCMMSIEFLEAEMVNLSEEDVVEKNHYKRLIYMIWPMITYIVFISICVHGGSIAVYSWGKAIYRRCVQ